MTNLHLEPGTRLARGADLRGRRGHLPRDEPQLVDRRQAPQLPVRDADRVGDQERQARPAATRRDLHRRHAASSGARSTRVAGPDEWVMYGLTNCGKGQPGPARARLARRVARSVPQRPGRRQVVSRALELAERALALVAGDEAEVVVSVEHSGFARYAGSEVHQPTLIDDTSVQLRVVRDGSASAVATTNRTDDEGLAELAGRAAERRRERERGSRARPGSRRRPSSRGSRATTRRPPRSAPTTRRGSPATAIAAAGRPRALRLLHERRLRARRSPRPPGLRASQRTTDATCLALAAADGASGYAERHVVARRRASTRPRSRARRRDEGGAHARRRRDRAGPRTAPCSSRTRSRSSSTTSPSTRFNGLGAARGAELLRRPDRRARVRPEGDARRRRARPAGPAAAVRLRGHAEAARRARRGGRRSAAPVWDRATAARAGAATSTGHALPVAVARRTGRSPIALVVAAGRGRVDRRARGARRRRHLRHAPPLPRASSTRARA